jgi:hypothetical protein
MSTAGNAEVVQPAATKEHHRVRAVAVPVLIVVASLLAIVSSTSVWVNRQALNTDAWVNATSDVLANKDVQQVLSLYVVDQLYQNVDISSTLEQKLPPQLASLAGPISAAIRVPAQQAVQRLLASPKVQAAWAQANRQAHAALVRVLENKTKVGSTANGTVTLDMGAFVQQLGQSLGLPASVLDKIPPDAGQITLIKSDRLNNAQKIVRGIRIMSAFLFIVVVALYALAVVLARDKRRTIRNIGWAVTLCGIILLLVQRAVTRYVVSLIDQPFQRAGHAVILIETSLLKQLAWTGVVYGLAIVVWAIIAGPSRVGTAVRRFVAPAFNSPAWGVAGGAVVVFVILLLLSPAPNPQSGLRILVLALLFAGAVVGLRRRTLAEFPDAQFSDIGDVFVRAWHRSTGRFHRAGTADGNAAVPVDLSTPEAPDNDFIKQS